MLKRNADFKFRIAIVALGLQILMFTSACVAADSSDDTVSIQYPAFVTACQIKKDDQYFDRIPVLVLTVSIGANFSYLYERTNGKDKFLAAMHYNEGGLDAEGGIWSVNRAADAYDYLISRPFRFFSSKQDLESSGYLKAPELCAIQYKSMKAYEKG